MSNYCLNCDEPIAPNSFEHIPADSIPTDTSAFCTLECEEQFKAGADSKLLAQLQSNDGNLVTSDKVVNTDAQAQTTPDGQTLSDLLKTIGHPK